MKKGAVAALISLAGAAVGAIMVGTIQGKAIEKKDEKVDKFRSYYNMLNQWLILKQEGKTLESYFINNGYKTMAIYGMGEMGNRLYDELKGASIQVKYAIDKETANTYSELEVLDPEDNLPEVDVIIVSAIFAFNEIEENLTGKFSCPIISLEDVVYEL